MAIYDRFPSSPKSTTIDRYIGIAEDTFGEVRNPLREFGIREIHFRMRSLESLERLKRMPFQGIAKRSKGPYLLFL